MNEQQIHVVLCDVGNVIVRATHEITHAILRDYGIPPEVAERFYANEDYADFSRGKLTGTEFVGQLMFKHLKINFPSYLELRAAHDAHIYDVDRNVVNILESLRAREISLAFATDTNAWQTIRVRGLVELERFSERVFRSNKLHALKADGGVFERILTELGEEPARVLFVDDSLEKVERAAALGMPTIHFKNAAQLRTELVRFGVLG